jgi:hypothetical protein
MKSRRNRRIRRRVLRRSTRKRRYRGGSDHDPVCNNADASVPCNMLDKQYSGKINQVWDTCIRMNDVNNHMIYVTPHNLVIKSIETLQIPEFHVSLANGTPILTNIMIEDKYINCFVYYCNNWYAIMRLFGTTINTGPFARTEKNKAYYKLSNNVTVDSIDPNKGSGLITILSDFDVVTQSKILKTSNAQIIKLKDHTVKNINKSNNLYTFNVLQRFRQEKHAANSGKTSLVQGLFDAIISR